MERTPSSRSVFPLFSRLGGGVLLAAAWGCGEPVPDPGLVQQLDRQQVEIYELEKDLREARQAARSARADTEALARLREEMSQLRQTLREKDREIAQLREDFERAGPPAEPPPVPRPPKFFPAITPMMGPDVPPPSFEPHAPRAPVEVFAVEGRTVPTGVREQTLPVTTGETVRDGFGERRPRIEYRTTLVTQYQYEVSYSLKNPGDTPRTLFIRAGMMTRTHRLAPHQILTNQTLQAARGSALHISEGPVRRMLPVSFPPE